jgi:hypothetical protein
MPSPLYVVLVDKKEAYGPFYKPEEASSVCKAYGGVIQPTPGGCSVVPPHRMKSLDNFDGVLHPRKQNLPDLPPKAKVIEAEVVPHDLTDPLTDQDRIDLAFHEGRIKQGMNDVMDSIKFIHDHKLYREVGTWEQYCAGLRDGMSRQQGSRLVMFAQIIGETPAGIEPPKHESGARELAILKDQGARQLAAMAADALVKQHPEWGMDHPTAEIYHGAVEAVLHLNETGVVDIDDKPVKPLDETPAILASVLVHAAEAIERDLAIKRDNAQWTRTDAFQAAIKEAPAWLNLMLAKYGADTEVRLVVFTRKVTPANEGN